MKAPQSAVDRWLMRESWYFLDWTATRDSIRGHDRFGAVVLALAPFVGAVGALSIEPAMAILGVPVAIIGAVHFGVSRWVKATPDLSEHRPPKLTRRAKRFLSRLSRKVGKYEYVGQHYYGRKLKRSPSTQIGSAQEFLDPVAYRAFESLATAYNRLQASVEAIGMAALPVLVAANERMASAIDAVAALNEFPERIREPERFIAATVEQFSVLASRIEQDEVSESDLLRDRLTAWVEALEDPSKHGSQRA
jgi:hypothetical protein